MQVFTATFVENNYIFPTNLFQQILP